MKTEFLKSLGLNEEQIKSIMAENGKDIEAEKEKAKAVSTELDSTKIQLAESNKTIADLKKNNGDNEALQAKVKEYEDTIKNQKADYEAKVRNLTLDSAIEKALTSSKAKHTDLLSGRIDRDKLVIGEDGKVTGLDEQIKGLKESYKDLFDEKISGNTPVNPEKGSLGNNTYEALMANADKMTAEEVAAQFMAIQNNK
ncbi:phage scaffolding protein [Clostridium culturomicium]|uniref:phage scaffolding protein n=1 Tax=Clostridium culturomicium TaxID=1499683 RepID=UPI0038578B9F